MICEVIGCEDRAEIVLWHGGLHRPVAVCDEHERVGLSAEGSRAERQREECGWWDSCHNTATGVVDHPELGIVKVCEVCAPIARLDAWVQTP